jgi:hypothetical protein
MNGTRTQLMGVAVGPSMLIVASWNFVLLEFVPAK